MNKERELKIDKNNPDGDWICDCGGELKFDIAEYAMESEEWLCEDCETSWSVGLTVTRDWNLAYTDEEE